MAMATGLIFTNQGCFIQRHTFFANCSSSNACIMALTSLLLVSFGCHSFLHNCIVDNLQYAFMASVRDVVSVKLAGALLTLFFAWNVTKRVWSSWKQSIVIHHGRSVRHYFWLIAKERFDNQTLYIFHNGWINCRGTFYAVIHL